MDFCNLFMTAEEIAEIFLVYFLDSNKMPVAYKIKQEWGIPRTELLTCIL